MSDLNKSRILRFIVVALALILGLALIALADSGAGFLLKKIDIDNDHLVETVVFWFVTMDKLWDWASQRVWIGRQQ